VKKTSLFILVLVILLASLTGCQWIESNQEVNIVSTVPSVTEILFALGCGDDIVGVDAFSNYPAEAMEIDQVGDYSGFDIEKVISLEPTVVFAGNKLQQEEIDTLNEFGINVIETEPTSFDDITASILEIGTAVGKDAEAEKLTDSINAAIEDVQRQTAISSNKPTVYYVMGIGEYGNWTSGEGSFINQAMEIAGGMCVTNGPDMAPWMNYPLEDLILADPDILIVSQFVMEADLLADATYAELTAVKEGNYYFINPDIIERPGPRIVEALKLMQVFIIGE